MPSKQTNVTVMDEVSMKLVHGHSLCLQACRYNYPGGTHEDGFRFIWRDASGRLLPQRGQARLPSLRVARLLMAVAEERPAFRACRGADANGLPSSLAI